MITHPLPTTFRTDKGNDFPIEVVKVNKRTFWISLLKGGKSIKTIKVSKKSRKLVW